MAVSTLGETTVVDPTMMMSDPEGKLFNALPVALGIEVERVRRIGY
jgi:hypothetical protein